MKQINKKCFSLCDDFEDELYDKLSEEASCDTYIDYTANTKESLKAQGFDNDLVANRLIELGAKEEEEVLIHIDY